MVALLTVESVRTWLWRCARRNGRRSCQPPMIENAVSQQCNHNYRCFGAAFSSTSHFSACPKLSAARPPPAPLSNSHHPFRSRFSDRNFFYFASPLAAAALIFADRCPSLASFIFVTSDDISLRSMLRQHPRPPSPPSCRLPRLLEHTRAHTLAHLPPSTLFLPGFQERRFLLEKFPFRFEEMNTFLIARNFIGFLRIGFLSLR